MQSCTSQIPAPSMGLCSVLVVSSGWAITPALLVAWKSDCELMQSPRSTSYNRPYYALPFRCRGMLT